MIVSPLAHGSARHPDVDTVVVEGELDPTTPGERLLVAPYHVHRSDEEIFYVLSGSIGFEVGNDEFIANTGDCVVVPPGTIHNWWNADSSPARYLLIMPKKLDDLIIAIHSGEYGPDDMADLYNRFDTDYIGWTR